MLVAQKVPSAIMSSGIPERSRTMYLLTTLYYGTGEQFNMKGRSKKYYRKIFRAYPDMVTLLQFREMLSGVSDNFARKLIHEKHVKSIFIKPHYYISKNSVIDYVLSEDYAKRKVRDHV